VFAGIIPVLTSRTLLRLRFDFQDFESGVESVYREEFIPIFLRPLLRWQARMAVDAEDGLGIFLRCVRGNPRNGEIAFESQGVRHLSPALDVRAAGGGVERVREARQKDFQDSAEDEARRPAWGLRCVKVYSVRRESGASGCTGGGGE
jgi:hypothetical protein